MKSLTFELRPTKRFWKPAIVLAISLAIIGSLYLTTSLVRYSAKALESSEGLLTTSNATSEDGHSDVFDRLGIKELYPTKAGGHTWYSSWDNGITR